MKCSWVLLLLPLPVQTKNMCGTLDHLSDSLTNNYIIWNYCTKDIPKINMGGAAAHVNGTVVNLQCTYVLN